MVSISKETMYLFYIKQLRMFYANKNEDYVLIKLKFQLTWLYIFRVKLFISFMKII